MDREIGRRRLVVVTGAIGAAAIAVASLVGFTRPAPAAHATTPRRDTEHRGVSGGGPQATDQPPDAVSSGS